MDQTMTKPSDWTTDLTGELLLLGLLSKLTYTEPDEALLHPLLEADIFAEAPLGADFAETAQGLALLSGWLAAQNGELTTAALKELQADYTALFLGPGKMLAPLWESVYFSEERLVFQERTLAVREWYRRFGLEPEKLYREPDDHIGLELSFMARLAGLALEALEMGDQAEFEKLIASQKEFFRAHLLQWGPAWAELVIQYARTDFYRGLGYLTLGALQAAARLFELPVPARAEK